MTHALASRPRNAVKHAARTGERIKGVHLTFPSVPIIEILAPTGLDYLYVDGEHGPFDLQHIEAACLAAERHGLTTIARVPDPSAATIVRFLDRGIRGIVVPHVHSVQDAARVVEAMYYAPLGDRSFGGGRPEYGIYIDDLPAHMAETNADISLGVMIESRSGLQAAAEIAALEGVDYLSFGLNDLSQSMGFGGQPGHPAVTEAVERASELIRAAGKPIREDFMTFAWINRLLAEGARQLLG